MSACLRSATVLCSMMLWTAAAGAETPTPRGVWLHDNERIQVAILPCGDRLCGKVVWLRNPYEKSGEPRTDSRNPNPSLRERPVLGLTVLSGLRRSGRHRWTDGRIYNPEDGNTYRCRVTMQDDATLQVHAFVMLPILGKTLTWTRVGEPGDTRPAGHVGMSG